MSNPLATMHEPSKPDRFDLKPPPVPEQAPTTSAGYQPVSKYTRQLMEKQGAMGGASGSLSSRFEMPTKLGTESSATAGLSSAF